MITLAVLIFTLIEPSLQFLIFPNLLPSVVNPDASRTTCEIATAKGYSCEIHTVTTNDGYFLEIHRIFHGNKGGPVVFLQHGLEDSSATWVLNTEKQSLGFLAADQGMDVWMGNVRGNVYSRKHKVFGVPSILNVLIPSDFWNFTFNEMAKYDLPVMVNYVLNKTNAPNLYYIGHSQGTLIGFIQFAEDFSWAKEKIKQFHALAPVSWLGHTTSPLRLIAPLFDTAGTLLPIAGRTQFGPENPFAVPLGTLTCPTPINDWVCTNLAMIVSGSTMEKENKTRNSVYSAKIPAGTSTMNILHYVRLMSKGDFQSYGPNPVMYHPNTSLVPTYLYWSSNDVFTQPADVEMLKRNIKVTGEYRQDDFNHMDFVWALNAAENIYSKVLKTISADYLLN